MLGTGIKHFMWRLLPLAFFSAAGPTHLSTPTAVGASQVLIDQTEEVVVYDSSIPICDVRYKPDAPVRAYVRDDGKIVAIAGHITNYALIGPSVDSLTFDCHPILGSVQSSDPARFTDRSWLAATWTADGTTLHALVHNEYQAHRFPGKCRYKEYMKCWYNTITNYSSVDSGQNFLPDKPIIAISPSVEFDGALGKHVGFYNPSNIVPQGRYLYTLVFTNGYAGQKAGVCAFRAAKNTKTWQWKGWNGADYIVPVLNPYRRTQTAAKPCVTLSNLGAVVGSVVWDKTHNQYIAASTLTEGSKVSIAYSTSPDLYHFSKLQTMIDLPTMWSKDCSDRFRYGYPSMVSAKPLDRNFSTTSSDGFLFLTRFHIENCKLSEQRDLVRFPYHIRP